ncbi:MAG: hypothetical protein L0241_21115 [Planctomycetia bacterium]|nr:hypothetical protein [Planctomycetia bacterium]
MNTLPNLDFLDDPPALVDRPTSDPVTVPVVETTRELNTTPLTGLEPWHTPTALALMHEADGLVGELGVDGRHPAIQSAADVVVNAHATRDLKTVRFAVAEFERVVRVISTAQSSRD